MCVACDCLSGSEATEPFDSTLQALPVLSWLRSLQSKQVELADGIGSVACSLKGVWLLGNLLLLM